MIASPANQYHSSLAEHLDPTQELKEAQALLDEQKKAGVDINIPCRLFQQLMS
jgi:hypothetical protein